MSPDTSIDNSRRTLHWGLVALIVAIGLVNAAAMQWHLYYFYRWLDIPMHLAGGFWIALATLTLLFERRLVRVGNEDTLLTAALAIAAAMTFGLLWEVFEFNVNTFIGLSDNDLKDTLKDLADDLAGALFGAVFFVRMGYNKIIQQ